MVPSTRSTHKPLLKSEVDIKSGIILIRSSKVKRGEKGDVRPVQVEPYLIERLKEQIASTDKDYPYVFIPMTRISRVFNKAVKRAGIPARDHLDAKLTAHSFRHTYATHHSKNGCDQFKLMAALGHKTISTTARYVRAQAPKVNLDLGAMVPRKNAVEELGVKNSAVAPERGGQVQEAGADEDDFVIAAI